MGVKKQFDEISEEYDRQRRQLIPCFDDYYRLPLSVLDFEGASPRILDIGSGTGLFASFVLERYPEAAFTLIDFSDKMMDLAKERFKDNGNFRFVVADYTKHDFVEQFDIVVSALSIHHLSPSEKRSLYRTCHDILDDGGVFINVDQVLSPSPRIEAMFSHLWRQSVEGSGLDPAEIRRAYERVGLDNPSTLEDQLRWLVDAGFKDADCLYKYLHFCVLYAKKR